MKIALVCHRNIARSQALHLYVPKLALIFLLSLTGKAHGAESKVLYETRFADKGATWAAEGKATVSTHARTPKGHSLKITMEEEVDQKSHWLSPAILSKLSCPA